MYLSHCPGHRGIAAAGSHDGCRPEESLVISSTPM